MKHIITLLLLVIFTHSFGQITYNDSILIKHTYKSKFIIFTEYLSPTTELLKDKHIRIFTNKKMNQTLSDSLTSTFTKSKSVNDQKLSDILFSNISDLTLDSVSNGLLINICHDDCEPCVSSIVREITDDEDIMRVIEKGNIKSIYVNYFQISNGMPFVTIKIKRRHSSKSFIFYFD